MTDTVEVVAARPLMIPAGRLEAQELFPATTGHAAKLADMDMLVLADAKSDKETKLERAVAAGKQARKELDERFAKEAKDQADAEAAAVKAAEAKAAKAAKTTEKEG